MSKLRSSLFKLSGTAALKKKNISITANVASLDEVIGGERDDPRCRFDSYPRYKELVGQRVIADKLHIENPFFRVQQGTAHASCVIENKSYINFSSYNYLDLNGSERVSTAAKKAIEKYGTSVSGSRILSGERPVLLELEKAIAKMHGVDDSVVFVSGHATNVTCIGYLFNENDLIIYDECIHNSVLEGITLSGAKRLMMPHNNLEVLEQLLAQRRDEFERVLIVVEGLYGMDGDYPDLPALIEIKKRHHAFLMIDEAHSIGVMGDTGRGIAEHFFIDPTQVDVWMGTMSKTLASCGGYIAGSRALVEHLRVAAPGQIYSVGLAPPLAAASLEAIRLMTDEPWRVNQLQQRARLFFDCAIEAGFDMGLSQGFAVLTLMCGSSKKAVLLSNKLFDKQIYALPIIYPAVAESKARLRFFVNCAHSEEQIKETIAMITELIS